MYKLLFLFSLTFLNIFANEKVEIYASKVETKGAIVNASGDVAVVYQGYYLSALKAIYNKETGELELIDNVRANQGGEYKLLGNHAKLNIKNKEKSFQPFYMLEKESKVWISGDSCKAKDNDFNIESGVVSGCNPNNPLWKIEFSSSDYNSESKWLNLYNARLYIYDIPVFYTPWFGYPLDKTRRTGLLKPTFGYSSEEGFLYQQPIYVAEQDWWDLELNPQIRTNRGKGIYSTARFTDSAVSKGELTIGYFKENDDYYTKNNLAKQIHNGFDFEYENNDFLNQWMGLNLDGQSGLYVDVGDMSDVDYINLSDNNTLNISTATQVLSRINLFYNSEDDYFGTYLKYYKDLTVDSNADTIQQLPTLHYHHYLETLLDDHVLYNIDIQANNKYREINKKVTQTNINIPISVHTSLLDEYLDATFTTNLYMQHSTFRGSEVISSGKYENGYTLKNDNTIDISTQLTKAYDDFSHVISFGSSYTFEGADKSTGFYEYNKEYCSVAANVDTSRCEFYNITESRRESQAYFSQYIYDALGTQIVYHRLGQSITYGNGKTLGDLENELEYRITKNINFYNNMFYNHEQKQFSKIYHKISYNDYGFNISLSHLYKDSFLDESSSVSYVEAHTSYLKTAVRYTYDSHYKFNAAYSYDIDDSSAARKKELGFLYTKRCWDFGIRYVEDLRPVLLTDGIGSLREKYIYFTISLRPFMESGNNPFFAFKLPDSEESN